MSNKSKLVFMMIATLYLLPSTPSFGKNRKPASLPDPSGQAEQMLKTVRGPFPSPRPISGVKLGIVGVCRTSNGANYNSSISRPGYAKCLDSNSSAGSISSNSVRQAAAGIVLYP
jgi:hypothetical protein